MSFLALFGGDGFLLLAMPCLVAGFEFLFLRQTLSLLDSFIRPFCGSEKQGELPRPEVRMPGT